MVQAGYASVAQSPAMKRKEGGYALRITGSGTDPLQLAQCAVEGADTSASERLNTHRLSCAENTLTLLHMQRQTGHFCYSVLLHLLSSVTFNENVCNVV